MLKFDSRGNAALEPIVNALDATLFVIPKHLGNFCRPTKVFNGLTVFGHSFNTVV